MKKLNKYFLVAFALIMLGACAKKDEDVVDPISVESLPQVVLLDDEGDGEIEDEDKMGFKVTLLDKVDPRGAELGGTIVPLQNDAVVHFFISELEGFTDIATYIKGGEAFYEINDCETSADQNIDLNFQLDPALGTGSFTFPAGVEEVEVELELDETLFDDGTFNADGRGFTVAITNLTTSESVKANRDIVFEYEVLDDEAIFGAWELDHTDSLQFAKFKKLFSMVEADLQELTAAEVDAIEFEFKYDELEIVVELVEEEAIDDCGTIEMENVVIEIAMDYDDLDADELEGELSFEGEIEQENGSELEFTYEGSFSINASQLSLSLSGEYEEVDEIELELSK